MNRGRKVTTAMFVEREGGELELTISGVYYPGCRGVKAHWADRFAPPDDPAEMDDIDATDKQGNAVELTEEEYDKAEEKLFAALYEGD